mgnify:FL=1
MANTLRMDPTRTTILRRQFMGEANRRFRELKGKVYKLIVTEDAFGLRLGSFLRPSTFSINQRFAFETDPNKMK